MSSIPLGHRVTEDDHPHLGGFVHGGDPNTWCPEVWRRLVDDNGVRSVVDIGCGEGDALRWFLDAGMHAIGVEGSCAAIALSGLDGHIVEHDFQEGPCEIDGRFDLGWCAEFVEHVSQEFVDNYLPLFASCQVLAMTHAEPGQDGWHHVNCQPAEYWVSLLAGIGMVHDAEYGAELRRLSEASHVRRSLLVFRNQA